MWRSGSPHTSSIRGSPGRARSTRFAPDSALEGDGFKPSVPSLTQTRSNGDVQHPCAAVGHARLAHPTIRDDYPPYPRSVIAGTNA
jgi:hypothetical protein